MKYYSHYIIINDKTNEVLSNLNNGWSSTLYNCMVVRGRELMFNGKLDVKRFINSVLSPLGRSFDRKGAYRIVKVKSVLIADSKELVLRGVNAKI